MRFLFGRFVASYFDSFWVPAVTCLASLLCSAFAFTTLLRRDALEPLLEALLYFAIFSLLGILLAAIWNLVKRRWAKGVVNLLMLPVCGIAMPVAFAAIGRGGDGFADGLKIPPGLDLTEPGDEEEPRPGGPEDAYQAALVAALGSPGSGDATVTGQVAALSLLMERDPGILRRFLASSPAWRVFEEDGNRFATRRWMVGPAWRYNLHGYYSRSDLDRWSKAGIPDFQSRLTIGLSGKPWWRGNSDTTWLKAGESATATLSKGNGMHESHCVVSAGKCVVEAFEQSGTAERRLTKAALAQVNRELAALLAAPTVETIRSLLPAGSVRRGEASVALIHSFQPGLYDTEVWVNPGEPGMIYLKAFEVTKGTPLSADPLKEKSNEWVGWSDDPGEQFFANTTITVYEGDWGKPYAARFEVWFAPDSGGPERKLLEKVFKIEGWQR